MENICKDVLKAPCNRPGGDCAACPAAWKKARELLGPKAFKASSSDVPVPGKVLVAFQKPPEDITFLDSMLALVGAQTFQGKVVIRGGIAEYTRQ